ncbi:MAG: hypothetical protein C4530_09745 [Desulfobacteraceae bacterium]|nr:MAG: hypothetical protein C4530_09745 [Desulfobacteraceae bacterium]
MRMRMIYTVLLSLFFSSVCMAAAPHEIAGYVLGGNIGDYQAFIDPKTDMRIRYFESIHEVEVKRIPGFKSGLIRYGTCAEKGRILQIKLKYLDSSKTFYDELLERFKQRFGKPSEWQGDPFHVVIAWKWTFTDKENNRISLHLQHNTRDLEDKLGNSVKLSLVNGIEKESRCFDGKSEDPDKTGKEGASEPPDWDRLLPR